MRFQPFPQAMEAWYDVTVTGAVLTQEEIDQLMGKLESVTSILQEREKARLKESKVCLEPLASQPPMHRDAICCRRVASSLSSQPGSMREFTSPKIFVSLLRMWEKVSLWGPSPWVYSSVQWWRISCSS